MNDFKTHYDALGLRPKSTLTTQEIKAAYHEALLAHHPDRSKSISVESQPSVDQITAAYRVLSDSKLREEYDRDVLPKARGGKNAFSGSGHDGIPVFDLEELKHDEDERIWYKACRCGNEKGFIVTEAELEDIELQQPEEQSTQQETLVGCQGCSLLIRVTFAVEPA